MAFPGQSGQIIRHRDQTQEDAAMHIGRRKYLTRRENELLRNTHFFDGEAINILYAEDRSR